MALNQEILYWLEAGQSYPAIMSMPRSRRRALMEAKVILEKRRDAARQTESRKMEAAMRRRKR